MLDIFDLTFFSRAWQDLPDLLIVAWPLWLIGFIFLLGVLTWEVRKYYARRTFLNKQKNCLIEIKLPKEMLKSPLAMELFLMSLFLPGGEATWYDKYWLGKCRAPFSLEIVSLDGVVHFYIWMREAARNYVESALYAQFPGVEIFPADDYAQKVFFEKSGLIIFGTEFKLTKEDAYPIKTYVDYGLDKDPKDEFKVDPLTPLIEFFGSLKKGEQMWLQIVVRAYPFKDSPWKEEADKVINEIMGRDPKTRLPKETPESKLTGLPRAPQLSKEEQEVVVAIQRSLSKLAFEVGIRSLYIAEKDKFTGFNITGLLGLMKQFSSNTLNGFKLSNVTGFDFPWQDYKNWRVNKKKRAILAYYKLRSFFYPPYHNDKRTFVLNTEELATLFHFPGVVSQTPTFTRIASRKAEAPANLPVE
jgi:hypothetical protein